MDLRNLLDRPSPVPLSTAALEAVPLPVLLGDVSRLLALLEPEPPGTSYEDACRRHLAGRTSLLESLSLSACNEAASAFLRSVGAAHGHFLPPEAFSESAWLAFGRALDALAGGAASADFPLELDRGDGSRAAYSVRISPASGGGQASTLAFCLVERSCERRPLGQETGRFEGSQLFANTLVGFASHEMVFDAEGRPVDYRFLEVNPAFERFTGLKREDILGHTVREVLPGLEARWLEVYGGVVSTGRPVFVRDYTAALGRYFEVWAYRPAPGRFAVMVQDVTERMNAEALIREQREKLEIALDASGAGLWELDLSSRAFGVDARWAELIGYEPAEIPATLDAVARFIKREDISRLKAAFGRALDSPEGHLDCEVRLRRKDDTEFWAQLRGRVADCGCDGSPLRVVGTLLDVDQRKRTELAEAQQRLLLSSLLDSLDDLAFFKDLGRRFLGCNRAFERYVGKTAADIVGRTSEELFPPAEAALMREEDEAILGGSRALRRERPYRGISGERRILEVRKTPLRDPEGRVLGVAGVGRDISERHDAEAITAARLRILEFARGHDSAALGELALCELADLAESAIGFAYLVDADRWTASPFAWATCSDAEMAPPQWDGSLRLDPQGHGPFSSCVAQRSVLAINDSSRLTRTGVPPGHPAFSRGILVPILREERVVAVLGVAERSVPYDDRDVRLVAAFADQVWDLLQARISEERLAESDQARRLALEVTQAGFWEYRVREGVKRYDERCARMLGRTSAELEGGGVGAAGWAAYAHPEDWKTDSDRLDRYLEGLLPSYESELRFRHKDGNWIWTLERGEIVERDAEGRPLRVIGLAIDVTRLKETEASLRDTLREKEALLRELYHRTNNTLQLIAAMMELKKQELGPGPTSRAFDDILAKLFAIALVQEKIYQSGSLSKIDLGDYLRDLAEILKREAPLGSGGIRLSVNAASVPISVDAAIPCGIVVSELVNNSLIHGFRGREEGCIELFLAAEEDEDILLEVSDDGEGPPPGFSPAGSARLGLRTVIGIGEEQLRGVVRFNDRAPGFSVSLRFKDRHFPVRL